MNIHVEEMLRDHQNQIFIFEKWQFNGWVTTQFAMPRNFVNWIQCIFVFVRVLLTFRVCFAFNSYCRKICHLKFFELFLYLAMYCVNVNKGKHIACIQRMKSLQIECQPLDLIESCTDHIKNRINLNLSSIFQRAHEKSKKVWKRPTIAFNFPIFWANKYRIQRQFWCYTVNRSQSQQNAFRFNVETGCTLPK